jgi:sugar/nucleoside kinase (ribokinase family)
VKTLLNTAPFAAAAAEAALLADIVIMNETELEAFAMAIGHPGTNPAAFFAQVRRKEDQIFVVTRGKGERRDDAAEGERLRHARRISRVDLPA